MTLSIGHFYLARLGHYHLAATLSLSVTLPACVALYPSLGGYSSNYRQCAPIQNRWCQVALKRSKETRKCREEVRRYKDLKSQYEQSAREEARAIAQYKSINKAVAWMGTRSLKRGGSTLAARVFGVGMKQVSSHHTRTLRAAFHFGRLVDDFGRTESLAAARTTNWLWRPSRPVDLGSSIAWAPDWETVNAERERRAAIAQRRQSERAASRPPLLPPLESRRSGWRDIAEGVARGLEQINQQRQQTLQQQIELERQRQQGQGGETGTGGVDCDVGGGNPDPRCAGWRSRRLP